MQLVFGGAAIYIDGHDERKYPGHKFLERLIANVSSDIDSLKKESLYDRLSCQGNRLELLL